MRAGPAGILLRYRSPFGVANTFRCLEALYPGRVDLGIARGAADPSTAAALLDDGVDTPDCYERKVTDLVGHLRESLPPDHPHADALPTPRGVNPPETWVLASGAPSGGLAARLGAALSLGLFLKDTADSATPAVVERYRAEFRPTAAASRPRWNLAVAGICAETLDDAVDVLRQHTNPHIIPTVFGTPEQCWARLEFLAEQYRTDEIVFAALGSTHADRLRTFRLLAREAARRHSRWVRLEPTAAGVA